MLVVQETRTSSTTATVKHGGPLLVQHGETPRGYITSSQECNSELPDQEYSRWELEATARPLKQYSQDELPRWGYLRCLIEMMSILPMPNTFVANYNS